MAKKLPQILTQSELTVLLDQPNVRTITGLRNRCVLELMAHGGLRVGEIINLKPGDIRWDTGEVEIHNGKGGRERVIPLHRSTMDWLHLWNEKRPKHSRYFFTTISGAKPGKQINSRYPDQMVKRYAKETGIQEFEVQESGQRQYRIKPHALRHTYASSLLDSGFSLAEVQQLLGHSNIITTSVYLHVNPKDLRQKVQSAPTAEESDLKLDQMEAAANEMLAMVAQARGVPNQPDKDV